MDNDFYVKLLRYVKLFQIRKSYIIYIILLVYFFFLFTSTHCTIYKFKRTNGIDSRLQAFETVLGLILSSCVSCEEMQMLHLQNNKLHFKCRQ